LHFDPLRYLHGTSGYRAAHCKETME
jgi:hypothetical protein